MAAALMLPLALAWACVPGAAIGFDRAVYEYRAGETVSVLGRAFAPQTQVTLMLAPPSGSPTPVGNGVLTDSFGNFRDAFVLPAAAAPGDYVVVASVNTTDSDGHGRTYEARESFRVMAPPAPMQPPAAAQPQVPAPAVGMSFKGTAGNDTIVGTQFADMISCGAGDDVVNGGGGNDAIDCGAGKDRIDGGPGDDRVSGGPGNDRLSGGQGNDSLKGGVGNDSLKGGVGNDSLKGGAGNDTLRGSAGKDKLLGGPGRDTLFRARNDVLSGGPGRDRMIG